MPHGIRIAPQTPLTDADWKILDDLLVTKKSRSRAAYACFRAVRLLREAEMVPAETLFIEHGRAIITNSQFNDWMRLAGLPYRLYSLEEGSMWKRFWGITKIVD